MFWSLMTVMEVGQHYWAIVAFSRSLPKFSYSAFYFYCYVGQNNEDAGCSLTERGHMKTLAAGGQRARTVIQK